ELLSIVLGVKPSAETERLHQEIVARRPPRDDVPVSYPEVLFAAAARVAAAGPLAPRSCAAVDAVWRQSLFQFNRLASSFPVAAALPQRGAPACEFVSDRQAAAPHNGQR